VSPGGQQRIEGDPPGPRAVEIVPSEAVRGHSSTISPGFQSGLRSQYS
jgi:hypothetical protein